MDQKYLNSPHIHGMNVVVMRRNMQKKVMSIFSGTVDIHAKTHFTKIARTHWSRCSDSAGYIMK